MKKEESKIKRKSILIAIVSALATIMLLGAPVLAADPKDSAEANVVIVDVDVSPGGSPQYVGTDVTVSGTIGIVAKAESNGKHSEVNAESNAGFTVTDPDLIVVVSGNNPLSSSDSGKNSEADASQSYSWSVTFTLSKVGDWIVNFFSSAYASWTDGGKSGSDSDSSSDSLTITASSPPPPPPPPPPPIVHVLSTGTNNPYPDGRFSAMIGGSGSTSVGWGNAIYYGGTLESDLTEIGVIYKDTYKIFIPKGTKVSSSLPGNNGVHYLNVSLWSYPDILKWTPNGITFSNPVVFSKLVGDQWVELYKFTKIVDGQPVLYPFP